MSNEWITIGKPEIRKDARSKADGSGQFTADVPLPDKKHGFVVRSTHHHAKIISIKTDDARACPGVIKVLIAQNLPSALTFGSLVADQPVLAQKVVRHIGEPVAIVIAETLDQARQAATVIEVKYRSLPAVLDPIEAAQPGAPKVHPYGNTLSEFDLQEGDPTLAFSNPDLVCLEDDFAVQRISPGYMEPENSLARVNRDGSITCWVNSQKPFDDQKTIAEVLGIPITQVQVIGALVGGAFGGKEDSGICVLTALAAWSIQGSVQICNARKDSFTAHPKRHPARIHIKMAADKTGKLQALEINSYLDTGAYASYGPAVGSLFTEMAAGPYYCPATHIHTRVMYTHSPFSGAMRGFGAPQAHFAIESAMNMLAEKLGMDPLTFRRINILKPGDQMVTQVRLDETARSLPKCLDVMETYREWMKAVPVREGMVHGIGYALAIQSMGLGAKVLDESAHRLEWLPDGKVTIYLGAPDLGQGLATVAEQMVAESLGLPFDQVFALPLDTFSTPNGGVTCGSRMTYLAGNALRIASIDLINNLLAQAAQMLQVPQSELRYLNGTIQTADHRTFPVSEFTSRCADSGQMIAGYGKAEFVHPPETTPQHLPIGMPHIKFAFAGQIALVEVDPKLGRVYVKEIVSINDLGKVINRATAEGQLEGGISMGIGYALYEDMPLKSNGNWVDSFSEYLIPTSLDVPEKIHLVMLEIPEADGPFGAKGVAEISLVPTAPAIANAVYDALKVRVKTLPITAEKVLEIY
jgi:CO/xanthine dehydrogenase Mo-binding subunit